MLKKVLAIAVVVCSALVFPPTSEAGLADFIWGLSGPQMLGWGGGCRWALEDPSKKDICEHGSAPTLISTRTYDNEPRIPVFFSVGGTFYWSTGTNSSTQEYRWFDVGMVAFEPGISYRSASFRNGRSQGAQPDRRIQLYHGVGPTLDYVFPMRGDFDSFGKAGVKVTPIEVLFHQQHLALALNLRYYPNRFTDDQFQPGPRLDIDRSSEWTWGFSVGILSK